MDDKTFDDLLNKCSYKMRVIEEAKKDERAAESARRSHECELSNTVIALAKHLKAVLGDRYARELTGEMVSLTGWEPPVPVPVDLDDLLAKSEMR